MCYSGVQSVAVCYSVLQCVTVCYSVLQCGGDDCLYYNKYFSTLDRGSMHLGLDFDSSSRPYDDIFSFAISEEKLWLFLLLRKK